MNAVKIAKVWLWLDQQKPGASKNDLKKVAEEHFGKITWDSQQGYGEGLIICEFKDHNIKGYSSGDCTSEEALLDALEKLINERYAENFR